MATNREQVLELYTAMFNRAADIDGLNYWVGEMENNGWSINDVANSFAQQTEYNTAYPSSSGNNFFITSIYQNLLGRSPDQGGLDYWVDELDQGSVHPANAVLAIIQGAKANSSTQGQQDAQLIADKTSISDYFANTLGLNDLTQAKSVMSSLSSDSNRVSSAQESMNSFAAQQLNGDALSVHNGHKYLVVKTAKNYSEAKAAAEAITNGSLAKIDNAAEDAFIFDLLKANNLTASAQDGGGAVYAWIGASDSANEGSWTWSDGSAVDYSNWGSAGGYSEPDNFNNAHLGGSYTGQQDYAAVAVTDWPVGVAGQWNDIDGVNQLAYVVEFA